MIKIRRSPKPKVLSRCGMRWTNRFVFESIAQLTYPHSDEKKKAALAKYRNAAIRVALDEMCHSKCAYCESKIGHADYAQIEHYKPSSTYPQNAFDWDNLLLACGICNGKQFKSDRFPTAPDGGPLLNPCIDDPSDHLSFEFDYALRCAFVRGTTTRGEITETLLGLNRPKLVIHRSTDQSSRCTEGVGRNERYSAPAI